MKNAACAEGASTISGLRASSPSREHFPVLKLYSLAASTASRIDSEPPLVTCPRTRALSSSDSEKRVLPERMLAVMETMSLSRQTVAGKTEECCFFEFFFEFFLISFRLIKKGFRLIKTESFRDFSLSLLLLLSRCSPSGWCEQTQRRQRLKE